MKRCLRSIYYWFFNMEKVFLAGWASIAAVLLFHVLLKGSASDAVYFLKIYFPMIGVIFSFAIMMSASAYYIPQSLSFGGTRREVFAGMECMIHIVLCQSLILAMLINALVPKIIFETEYIKITAVFYLVSAGIGNAICAGGLKFGARASMIIYIVLVIVTAGFAGGMGAYMGAVGGLSTDNILEVITDYWPLAAAFDVLMAVVCYRMMRKYEVRA